jgi:hypothetical protein
MKDWRIQPSKIVQKLKESEQVAMREYMVGSWVPVRSGVFPRQTVLVED